MEHLTKAENPHDKEREHYNRTTVPLGSGGAETRLSFFSTTFVPIGNHPMILNAVLFHWKLHPSHIHVLTTPAYILNHHFVTVASLTKPWLMGFPLVGATESLTPYTSWAIDLHLLPQQHRHDQSR